MKINRRTFITRSLKTAFTMASVPAVAGVYGVEIEPYWLKKTTYALASPKWPTQAPELHIALAADLHVGCPSVGLNHLEEIVGDLNNLKADIILLPGDFLTQITPGNILQGRYIKPAPIAAILKNLTAPLGVYATLGNHDWLCDGKGLWLALENSGIHVLENDALHIQSLRHDFWIAGLADDTTRRPDWKKIEEKIDDKTPVVLMTHDPATFLEKSTRPVVTLAGHTHGGQINIPFITGGRAQTRAPLRYYYGHIAEDGCDLIVTSGIGTTHLPVRFNARPEIIDLKIRANP